MMTVALNYDTANANWGNNEEKGNWTEQEESLRQQIHVALLNTNACRIQSTEQYIQ